MDLINREILLYRQQLIEHEQVLIAYDKQLALHNKILDTLQQTVHTMDKSDGQQTQDGIMRQKMIIQNLESVRSEKAALMQKNLEILTHCYHVLHHQMLDDNQDHRFIMDHG